MSSLLCSSRRNKKKDDDGEQMQIVISTTTAAAAAMRKGPWTDDEDEQLVRFVRLLGERRWDFLAKVSGLRRTGKSCRLRWVNYLHPDLRRGRITADEERRIVELHAQWGGRWSRIARSLPGRTDNEIKNFWRTRARKKKALEEERKRRVVGAASTAEPASVSSPVTTTSSSSSSTAPATKHEHREPQEEYGCSSMDQLWDEIAAADEAAWSYACWGGAAGHYYYYGTAADAAAPTPPASPPWEYCGSDYSLWRIDDQEYYTKMLDSS